MMSYNRYITHDGEESIAKPSNSMIHDAWQSGDSTQVHYTSILTNSMSVVDKCGMRYKAPIYWWDISYIPPYTKYYIPPIAKYVPPIAALYH